jgi:hypothetical protein
MRWVPLLTENSRGARGVHITHGRKLGLRFNENSTVCCTSAYKMLNVMNIFGPVGYFVASILDVEQSFLQVSRRSEHDFA